MAILGEFKTDGELRVDPFSIPEVWHIEFYCEILLDTSFWRYLANSLFIATMSVVITIIVASMAAFVFLHIKFFGST